MVTIKVLGSGCANCKRLEQIASKVVDALGIQASIEKVTDFQKIVDYGIMATPGLVVNEKVVSYGRIPSEAEVDAWVREAA